MKEKTKKINASVEKKNNITVNDTIQKKNTNLSHKNTEEFDLETQSEKFKRPEFTKGLYLSAYSVATDRFKTILDSAEAAGINTIVFDVKNMNGHILANLPLKSPIQAERMIKVINIKKVVKTLHSRDMRAVARVVMFHDQFLAVEDTLLRPVKSDGKVWQESKRRKPSWLDPSNQKVQSQLLTILEETLQQGVDEIQLDYIRFPTQGNISEAIFSFQKEDSLRALQDSTYIFRKKKNIIEEFLIKVRDLCNDYKTPLTGDVFAIVSWQRKADIDATGQDISIMSKYFDAIHPMIYSSHFSDNFGYRENIHNEPYYIVYKAAKLTENHTGDKCLPIPFIQANSWKVNYKKEFIYSQITAIKNLKLPGYILWNSANNYYRTLNWIRNFN